jgi:hypothetical protein
MDPFIHPHHHIQLTQRAASWCVQSCSSFVFVLSVDLSIGLDHVKLIYQSFIHSAFALRLSVLTQACLAHTLRAATSPHPTSHHQPIKELAELGHSRRVCRCRVAPAFSQLLFRMLPIVSLLR